MPITIMNGAGDMPNKSNGAAGRAKPRPHRFRLLKPKLMSVIPAAVSNTPNRSICTSGRPRVGLSLKLRRRTTAESAIRIPNAGRQPI